MANTRTIITIPETDKKWLESYSKAHHISMAEAIRKGITRLRRDEGTATFKKILSKTCGLWQGKDGLSYQKKMRSEWDR